MYDTVMALLHKFGEPQTQQMQLPERSRAILNCLLNTKEPLSKSEISKKTGFNKISVGSGITHLRVSGINVLSNVYYEGVGLKKATFYLSDETKEELELYND
jgi:biotin operon repressor